MNKYVVIYHAPASAVEQTQAMTSEQMQDGMKQWFAWAEKCGDGLVDFGTPLADGHKVTTSGSSPSDKGVIGYSILQAENMEAAQAMVQDHPHLAWAEGCEVEVHESQPVPM